MHEPALSGKTPCDGLLNINKLASKILLKQRGEETAGRAEKNKIVGGKVEFFEA
ncbi:MULTISPECIES: hypothetical protein [Pantoea]|uniref:hypothetical protein n=1 Tax=Pantoea TaxID=53335 RepID=UPI001314BC0D|nr:MULTISPECIES: hypothetical protein [Pantoea]MBZ6384632.1 hypothetical protein [Pantoea piersonii]MBZ6401183.1 hypothetical protein [Pantoea piersonii]MBZ6407328.1 hypothetical protein [Pantoea piersonii]MBZ6427839.1 hypothetical protein [Pantoea piersonii]NYB03468.1 hypothetical protein [Pantoea piersonii]